MSSLRALRQLREIERNQIAAVEAELQDWQTQSPPELHRRLHELLRLQEKIRLRYEKLQNLNERILAHKGLREVELPDELSSCETYSVQAVNCLSDVNALVMTARTTNQQHPECAAPPGTTAPPTPSSSSSATVCQRSERPRTPPRAPEFPQAASAPVTGTSFILAHPSALDISPEIFDGNRLQYRAFITQFPNWVGKRASATPMDRLTVLRKYLKGDAKTLVGSLEVTDANYEVALKLLEDNFGKVSVERQKVMATLFALPQVHKPNDTVGLRKLLSKVQAGIKCLEGIGNPLSAYALAFEPKLRAAVPTRLVFDFLEMKRLAELAKPGASTSAAEEPDPPSEAANFVSDLVDYLVRYTSHREENVVINSASGEKEAERRQRPFPTKDHSSRNQPPESQPLSTVAASNKRPRLNRDCLFCKSTEHRTSRCSAPLSLKQRVSHLKKLKRCVRCFRAEHTANSTCQGPRAECAKCRTKEHYTCMHPPADTVSAVREVTASTTGDAAEATGCYSTLMFLATAYVIHNGAKLPIRIFLDSGSSLTFVAPGVRRLMPQLRPVARANLKIQAFSSLHNVRTERFKLTLQSTYGDSKMDVFAYEHEFGVHPVTECPPHVLEAIRKFQRTHQLADRSLTGEFPYSGPTMLVGMDQFYKIALIGHEKVLIDGVVAKDTRLGWIVGGPTMPAKRQTTVASAEAVCCAATLSRPAADIERLWRLDQIGIEDPTSPPGFSKDEKSALNQFESTITHDGERYEVSFPKRSTIHSLLNNKAGANRRLNSKLNQLRKDSHKYGRYHEEIMKFVAEGHAEKVTDFRLEDSDACDGTFYMPHHAVISSTEAGEKWRVVFDCSASARGSSSLNSHLLTGPNLNPDLVKLLLNFRLFPCAVASDIKRAYLQIKVAKADQPFFRFLWRGPQDKEIQCYQMLKVTWGAASSGFLLAATLREHFKRTDPTSAHRFGEFIYHDDFLRSFPTAGNAVVEIDQLIKTLTSAGMSLDKWKTNSKVVIDHLTGAGFDSPTLNLTGGGLLKVLGISWTPTEDQFCFVVKSLSALATSGKPISKRFVLSLVASLFDPLGWLSPFVLRGKRIIQQLWSENLQWDEPITSKARVDFEEWVEELQTLAEIKVPRCYAAHYKEPSSYNLHVFADASPASFAAAAYIQCNYPDRSSHCSLLMSKSRLAPRDGVTLPRLELLAALTAVRLKEYLIGNLDVKFNEVYLYTDSLIVYFWVTSETVGRWKVFVANRVQEIQKSTTASQWFHVKGENNVSDNATRGISAKALRDASEWWSGPDWLTLSPQQQPISQPRPGCSDLEVVRDETRKIVMAVAHAEPQIDLNRFSSYGRALRVIALLLKIAHFARKQNPPTATELLGKAEVIIIRWTQELYFAKEISSTRAGEKPPTESKLSAFQLHLDENSLLRAKTRLTAGDIFTYDEKNPIVIPGDSRLATLLILQAHRTNAHFGVSMILNILRRKFWITRGRRVITGLLRQCVICKKRQGSLCQQIEAPLPPERTTLVAPFSSAGLDFCGPFFVRGLKRRETPYKTYCALFTCCSTRAVHLELVVSMDTPQTHLALRRFLAIYPACSLIVSDNFSSFAKAATEIKTLFNTYSNPAVKRALEGRRVEWRFQCPRAPFHGGFFERLVQTVKRALAKTLGRSLVSFEEMRTILQELASVINDRPITYASGDPDEPTALTPSHFLRVGPTIPSLSSTIPLDELGPNEAVNGDRLRVAHRKMKGYFESLSERWKREYMLQLRSASMCRGTPTPPIRVGDVCLLKDDNAVKVKWNLVKILEAHTGRDGNVRTYTVRFHNGYESRRAAQLLIPLEVV